MTKLTTPRPLLPEEYDCAPEWLEFSEWGDGEDWRVSKILPRQPIPKNYRDFNEYRTYSPLPNMPTETENLTVRKDRVLEAAKGCSDATRILKKLFPEAFEPEDKSVDLSTLRDMLNRDQLRKRGVANIMCIRSTGGFANKAIWLSDDLNWRLIKDDDGELVLIPTKK